MNGQELCGRLCQLSALRRTVLRNSQGGHACRVYFELLGVNVAEGGGSDETSAEEAMAVQCDIVRDLLDVAELDADLAEMYDVETLRKLLDFVKD
jgi:hypothetical protein